MENQYNNNENNSGDLFKDRNRQNVFQTPDDFFEKLPGKISDRIRSDVPVSTSTVFTTPKLIGIAACLAVVIIAGMFYVNTLNDQHATATVWSYDDLIGSGIQMDEGLILEAYEPESATGNIDKNGNETQHLQDYLIENNTDISLIINEL